MSQSEENEVNSRTQNQDTSPTDVSDEQQKITSPESEEKPTEDKQVFLAEPTPEKLHESNTNKKSEREWQFAVGLGLTLSKNEAEFKDIVISSGGATEYGEANFNFENTMSILFEARKLSKNSWGFLGGVIYERSRKLEDGMIITNSGLVIYFYDLRSTTFQTTNIYGSTAYRWDNVYVPFGLNYSYPELKPSDGSGITIVTTGGLGAQLGIGFIIAENLAIELYSWVTGLNVTPVEPSGRVDLNDGTLSSLYLKLKYLF